MMLGSDTRRRIIEQLRTTTGDRSVSGAGHPSTPGAGHPSTPGAGHPSTPGAGHPSTPGAGHPSTPGAGHPSTASAFAALLEGRARIVDCFDGGRQRYVVLEPTPEGEPLSGRERSVVLALAVELSNKVAAIELSISQATASAHVASALRKLGVDRLTLLRALAVISDWIAPSEMAA